MSSTTSRRFADVLGVKVDAIDMEAAVDHVDRCVRESGKGYICVAGVHGMMEARRSAALTEVYAGASMTVPDGMPLVWVGSLQGHAAMGRVTGPDLMLEIFKRKQFAGLTHFLYGGEEGVVEELRDKLTAQFPEAKIVGTWTPPFRPLTVVEQDEFVASVNELKPDIVWVGISCPRQEIFMAQHLPLLDTKLMFGVGAAFDFHTGRIQDCAIWIKWAGLQWFHRLLQDPRRLWRRYLRNNPAFVWAITLQLIGLRRYGKTEQRSNAPNGRLEGRRSPDQHVHPHPALQLSKRSPVE